MKLAIFGATGRTGRLLVEQALAAGYDVVALARIPSKLPLQDARLSVVQGDVTDPAAVTAVVRGADAVISVIGHAKGAPPDVQTVAARHIVAAMRQNGVRRLISLTGAGVDAPQDRPTVLHHLIKLALRIAAGPVLRDAVGHAAVIRQSGLDWTIVRAPMLTEGPRVGSYRVGWVGVDTGPRLARSDLAAFLLAQVTDRTYLGQLPMVSA